MKSTHLIRLDHNKPNFQTLDQSIHFLEATLDKTPDISVDDFEELIHFQDTDGSFKLLDSYDVISDARVDFCHVPTYLATAIIMKAYLNDSKCLSGKEQTILVPALTMCCARGLCGHGYDAMSGQIAAMRIFLRARVQDFIRKYPAMCPKFTMMINSIVDEYRSYIAEGTSAFDFEGWKTPRFSNSACRRNADVSNQRFETRRHENCEQDFREIVSQFPEEYYIFVYGTLLKGQRNYTHYLAPNEPCASAVLNGYHMFDIGSYPGIVPGKGNVKGEIYRINARQLSAIDRLEVEGDLYIRTPVTVTIDDDTNLHVNAYIYNRNVEGLSEIPYDEQPYEKAEKVWYVSYGSNLLEERLAYYIKGGTCPYNGRHYPACSDPTMPEESASVMIPYNMYYSNSKKSKSWKNSSVCFLDITKPGKAYGRAWLVTRRQLEHIHGQEGKSKDWYPERVRLEDINGIPAYTFSNREEKPHEEFSNVSAMYGIVLYRGMKETYPKMSDNDILSYLSGCGK